MKDTHPIIKADIEDMIGFKGKGMRHGHALNKTFGRNRDGEWYYGDATLVLRYGRKISDARVSVDDADSEKQYIIEVDYEYEGMGYTLSFMFYEHEYESVSMDALSWEEWEDALWGIVAEFQLRG